MKRLLLISLLHCFLQLYANEHLFNFVLSDFEVLQKGNQVDIIPKNQMFISDTYQKSKNMPDLPYLYVRFLSENNQKAKFKINVSKVKTIIEDKIIITPVPQVYKTSIIENTDTIKSDLTSYDDVIYPGSNVDVVYQQSIGQKNEILLKISPFIYKPNEGLFFIEELVLKSNVQTILIDNAEEVKLINKLCFVQNRESSMLLTEQDSATYLIITCDSLKDNFLNLSRWKTIKGVKAKIVTIEEIYNLYESGSNFLKIKQYLYDYYMSSDCSLKWVLLGGDDTIVPVVPCYAQVNNDSPNDIPTDLFYSCFGGTFDWNQNNNDTIGEINDVVNFLPSIFVSRLPIRTKKEIDGYTQKLLTYEQWQHDSITSFSLLQMGTQLWNNLPVITHSDAKQKADLFANTYLNNWQGDAYMFFDTYNDISGIDYAYNPHNINEQFESGYQFIHCLMHGSRQSHSTSSNNYTINDAYSLLNKKQVPIIVTMACQTNWFDGNVDPCLSEAFIRNPQGGAIGYFGSSRFGWGYKNNATNVKLGPSLRYNGNLFQQLFENNNYHWAEACAIAKYALSSSANNQGAYRWLQYSINPLGDPEMPIFTKVPEKFENVIIDKHNDTLLVTTGDIQGCRITITSDYGNVLFKSYSNVDSVFLTNVPTDFMVVITKENFVPYIYGNPLYIQNEIINEERHYLTSKSVIGNNVTVIKPYGNVVVDSGGKLIIEGNNDATLDKGVEIKLGGVLEIKN